MADPLQCLRATTIAIAIWNIMYSLIQIGIFGWQIKYVKDRQWEFENRALPATGAIDPFQARFPGLYAIYSESPERRRINALFAIAITVLVISLFHLCLSSVLLIGSTMQLSSCIWPWFFSAIPIIALSTAYAVIWWSGDVFGEQLVMSVAEFLMSLAVNSICVVIVTFYYVRLRGQLTSIKPKDVAIFNESSARSSCRIPKWRREWDEEPPRGLKKKLSGKARSRNSMVRSIRRTSDLRHTFDAKCAKFERLSRSPYHSHESLRQGIAPVRRWRSNSKLAHSCDLTHRSRSPGRPARPPQPVLTRQALNAHNRTLEWLRENQFHCESRARTDRNTVL